MKESILEEEAILKRADKGGALLSWKKLIARGDELAKAFLSLLTIYFSRSMLL